MEHIVKLHKNKGQTVLGLDCSSATIGWGLVSMEQVPILISYGYIKPLNNKFSLMERLSDVYDNISKLCIKLKPYCVAVEDIFLFMKGKSQAQTIVILAAFNRIASLAAYHYSKNVLFYSVHSIRKTIKELVLKSKKSITKDEMPNIIKENLDKGFEFRFNRKNNIAKETYDEADGIAVAWCHILNILVKDKLGQ